MLAGDGPQVYVAVLRRHPGEGRPAGGRGPGEHRDRRTPAESTPAALDGYGLRGQAPARPTTNASIRFLSIRPRLLLPASFRPRLAATPLRFARTSPPSGCAGDLHPQVVEHARHTLLSRTPPGSERIAPKLSRTRRSARRSERLRPDMDSATMLPGVAGHPRGSSLHVLDGAMLFHGPLGHRAAHGRVRQKEAQHVDKFWSTVAATVVAGVVAGIVLMIVQFVFRARKPDGK